MSRRSDVMIFSSLSRIHRHRLLSRIHHPPLKVRTVLLCSGIYLRLKPRETALRIEPSLRELPVRDWRSNYLLAIHEVDRRKLPKRIAEAQRGIVERARELF